jgi:hypothetical protein
MANGDGWPAAIGVTVHTGWVVAVVAGGSFDAAQIALRQRFELLGDADRFVFHAAAKAPRESARAQVNACAARAREAATSAVAAVLRAARAAGARVKKVAVVGSARTMPGDLDAILASHAAIHAAEGVLYTQAIVDGAIDAGLTADVLRAADLDARAAAARRIGSDALHARMKELGKRVGRPWSANEKNAVLAAWIVQEGRPHDSRTRRDRSPPLRT